MESIHDLEYSRIMNDLCDLYLLFYGRRKDTYLGILDVVMKEFEGIRLRRIEAIPRINVEI